MIHNLEQIHVSKGYYPTSAGYLIDIDHEDLWHFWSSELQTLAVFSRQEGLLFQDLLSALMVIKMLSPDRWAGCSTGTGEVKAIALGPEMPSSP